MALQQRNLEPKKASPSAGSSSEPVSGHLVFTPRQPWMVFLTSNAMAAIVILVLLASGRMMDGPGGIGANLGLGLSLVAIHVMLVMGLHLVVGASGQISLGHAAFYGIGAYVVGWPLSRQYISLSQPLHALSFYFAAAATTAAAIMAAAVIIGLIRLSARLLPALPAVLICLLVGWCLADIAMASELGRQPYLVWSQAWPALQALHAVILQTIAPPVVADGSHAIGLVVVMLAGAGAAGLSAWIIALASGGGSTIHLVLLTLGLAITVRSGLWVSGPAAAPVTTDLSIFMWCAIAAWLAIVATWRIVHSHIGRAMEVVREDPVAAATVGIRPQRQRMLAMVVGAAFAGVAGALRTQVPRNMEAMEFGLAAGIALVAILVIGGLHSTSGVAVAAIVLSIVPAFWPEWQIAWYGFLAIGMITVLRWRPDGLLDSRELWPIQFSAQRAARPPKVRP